MEDYIVAPDTYSTERFTLRSFMPDDGPRFMAARNASFEHCKQYRRWEEKERSAEYCEKYVRLARARYLLAEDFAVGVFSPDGQTMLGETSFNVRNGHAIFVRSAQMGMWIAASQAGQGLGTAVLRGMIDWGFKKWPWDRLAWMCDHRNTASFRIAEKSGMQHEGVLRSFLWYKDGPKQDLVCFGILREEWERDNKE